MNIPQNSLSRIHDSIKSELQEKFSSVLEANAFVLGKELTEFESSFAKFCDVKYAIGVASGYDALFVSLKILGVKPGDEVIVPAHTFIATWMAVTACGAKPIPVEVDEKDWTINTILIASKITSKTKGIIPVHLFGAMCQMDAIQKIADENNLFILEDFSQAQGAKFDNKTAGSFGNLNAASLYPGKNIGALGDAGVITTNNEELYQKALQFRNYGTTEKNKHEVFGLNSRLDNLQAAFLNVKLKYLQKWNEERNVIAAIYRNCFDKISVIQTQIIETRTDCVYHQFVILVEERDLLIQFLESKGIQTSIHYPIPIFQQEIYKGLIQNEDEFEFTIALCSKGLSLPMFPGLTESEVNYICQQINNYFEGK
jgi:dTDP-4-amino-4,6-dideoxygalactose transaminase